MRRKPSLDEKFCFNRAIHLATYISVSLVLPFVSSFHNTRHALFTPRINCHLHFTAPSPLRNRNRRPTSTLLFAKQTTDPWETLGLNVGETDKDVIRKAYRRMCFKYHPDATALEDKEEAAKQFQMVQEAYELLGKGKKDAKATSGSSSGRRKSYSASSSQDSFDFERANRQRQDEYDAMYDAGDDSFGAIFGDLFSGAAGTAAGMAGAAAFGGGSGGMLNDFLSFFEGNFPEYGDSGGGAGGGSSASIDAELAELLRSSDKAALRIECDDAEMLLQTLRNKLTSINSDIIELEIVIAPTSTIRFSERVEKEEELASCRARKKVIEGYFKTGQERLLRIQTRLKELRGSSSSSYEGTAASSNNEQTSYREQPNDSYPYPYGTSSSSSEQKAATNNSAANSAYSGQKNTSNSDYSQKSPPPPNTGNARNTSTSATESAAASTTRDTFGSSGRGRRGSSRRRSQEEPPQPSPQQPPPPPSSSSQSQQTFDETSYSKSSRNESKKATARETSTKRNTDTQRQRASDPTPSSPPHQRAAASSRPNSSQLSTSGSTRLDAWRQAKSDKKRLQEFKVDEEFDKLKRELGL